MPEPMKPLFTWVHLSDIHMSHGPEAHRWDQQLVLERLKKDVLDGASRNEPSPNAIFVTGDLAFSGGMRDSQEYTRAGEWLLSLASAIDLPANCAYVIPGNHDIQRNVAQRDRDVARMLRALRSGNESIDTVLGNDQDRRKLKKRLGNYIEFSKGFAPACLASDSTLSSVNDL